jgi:hypothetical protein
MMVASPKPLLAASAALASAAPDPTFPSWPFPPINLEFLLAGAYNITLFLQRHSEL